jgi:hypothetical protein
MLLPSILCPLCCDSACYVLGKLHLDVRLRPGVHEQHPVLTGLLDHARVQVVLCRPLLVEPGCGVRDHACEVRFAVVAVLSRNGVDGPADGEDTDRDPKPPLYAN